jgi:hypothetical protein
VVTAKWQNSITIMSLEGVTTTPSIELPVNMRGDPKTEPEQAAHSPRGRAGTPEVSAKR